MIKPTLAAGILASNFHLLRFPLLVSPKLDGIRAIVVDGVVMSRNGKAIPNRFVQHVLGHEKNNGLDGELIVGNAAGSDVWPRTSSGIMTHGNEPDFTYHVFDTFAPDRSTQPFARRLASLQEYETSRIVPLEHTVVRDAGELMSYNDDACLIGYEGVMLRDPNAYYKHGRSTLREQVLVKVKPFADAEAVIEGYEPLVRITGEVDHTLVGRLRLRAINGPFTQHSFSCGTGFDLAQRAAMVRDEQLVGKIVTFRYQHIGSVLRPRHPVFKGFRLDK